MKNPSLARKFRYFFFCVIFRYLNFRAKIEPIRLLSFGAKIQIFEKRFDYILTFKAKKIEFGLKHFQEFKCKIRDFYALLKCKLVFCPHFSLQLFQYVTFLKLYFQCQTMSGKCNPVVVVVVLKCKCKKQRLPLQILFRYRDKNHKLSE